MTKYCGNGKENTGYDLINISFCLDDYPREFMYTSPNGKRYFNLTLSRRKEVDAYGNTHSLKVNEYRKEENQEGGIPW